MTRILIIDDDPDARELVSLLLSNAGHQVLEAGNGRKGVRLAIEDRPDLVLCDISMPGPDGYEVLAELRKNPATASIPVIFLTGKSTREELRQGMELGADDYITKSFLPEVLVPAVAARLARQQPARESLRLANRALAVIRGSSDLLLRAVEEKHLLDGICRLLVEEGGYRFAWVGYAEPGERERICVRARAGDDACTNGAAVPPLGSITRGARTTERALRTATPVIRRNGSGCAPGAVIALPLLAGGHSFATLTIQSNDPDAFDQEEVDLLSRIVGNLAFGIVTLRMRDERTRVQDALDDLRHRNDLILNSAAEGICGTDASGILTFANPAAEEMLGWERGTTVGHPVHTVFHGDGQEPGREPEGCPLETMIARGISHRAPEEEFRRRDGTPLPVEYVTAPIRDNGTVTGAVIVFRNISHRKRAEEDVARAHGQVLQAEVDKKRFHQEVVHAVTHGKLHLVDADEVPALGTPVLELDLTDMRDYPAFRHALAGAAREMGMEEENAHEWVLASAEAVANALKHAGGGDVTVYADEARGLMRITDHGAGIRPEDLSAVIFQPGFSTAISLGMGYTLILRLADEVWLATGPGGTTVQIAKSLARHPEEAFPLVVALQRL